MTPARSFDGPREADLQSTQELEQLLVKLGLYKSKEEAARQEEVLGKLDKIVKEWVKELASQSGQINANAVLFTFGSYHLGVDEPGADIDTLCVGPKISLLYYVAYWHKWKKCLNCNLSQMHISLL